MSDKTVKKSVWAYTMTDAHNNAFGFSQDGYIYTYSKDSKTNGEAWLRMQRVGKEVEKDAKFFLYFADETEPCAFIDKYNNIYDFEHHYIATLERARLIIFVAALFVLVLVSIGIAVFLTSGILMKTTAPFADENTVELSIDQDMPSNGDIRRQFDIFGILDDENDSLYAENNRKIYPGLKGEYQFLMVNTGVLNLYYKLSFSEENAYNIPMRYRVKKGKDYIAGNETTWVDMNQMKFKPERIERGEEIVYTIEWQWLDYDDIHDTQLGYEAIANYVFHMNLTYESAY